MDYEQTLPCSSLPSFFIRNMSEWMVPLSTSFLALWWEWNILLQFLFYSFPHQHHFLSCFSITFIILTIWTGLRVINSPPRLLQPGKGLTSERCTNLWNDVSTWKHFLHENDLILNQTIKDVRICSSLHRWWSRWRRAWPSSGRRSVVRGRSQTGSVGTRWRCPG